MRMFSGLVSRRRFWLGGVLIFTVLAYIPIVYNGFTNWDDNILVTENPLITSFSFHHIVSWFTLSFTGQYQPLVMFSFAFDYSIDGLNPLVFHTTNLFLHLINIILLFQLLELLFRNSLITFFTTFLFAIHTLNVETVAWVTERKNTLYVMFFLASVIYYIYYLQRNKSSYYLLSMSLFIMALLTKGSAVILPVILLLVHYIKGRQVFTRKMIGEMIPFFLMSIVMGIIALIAQNQYGTFANSSGYPFWIRILLTGKVFMFYILKTFLPIHLSAFYPLPSNLKSQLLLLILTFFISYTILITALIISWFRQWKIIFFGLSFFLINLLLFLIPPGAPVMAADRYAYMSSIGLFIVLMAGFEKIGKLLPKIKIPGFLLLFSYIFFLGYMTFQRTKIWHDSLTLWNNVIENTGKSGFPLLKRGIIYRNNKDYQAALGDFNESLGFNPDYYITYDHRGYLFLLMKNEEKAIEDFKKSISLKPDNSFAHNSLGFAYNNLKRFGEALTELNTAIKLKPDYSDAYKNRGKTYIALGRIQEGCTDLKKSLSLGISTENEKEVIKIVNEYCP